MKIMGYCPKLSINMTKNKLITCSWCKREFNILEIEYRRQNKKGRNKFFCCRSCASKYKGELFRCKEVTKICPVCDNEFQSSTSKKASTFCSRVCASKGSVTDFRRQRARETGHKNKNNLQYSPQEIANTLRNREWWKYEKLYSYLTTLNIPHQFEYPIDNNIHDLALINKKIIIEFDGREHGSKEYLSNDSQRDKKAQDQGWIVYRINVSSAEVIDPALIKFITEPINSE